MKREDRPQLRIVDGELRDLARLRSEDCLILPALEKQTTLAAIGNGALAPGDRTIEHHLDAGAPIVGVTLRGWEQMIALIHRAYPLAFSRFAFLGRDGAYTPGGPVLLEANTGWRALFRQMLDELIGPIGFDRMVAQHV